MKRSIRIRSFVFWSCPSGRGVWCSLHWSSQAAKTAHPRSRQTTSHPNAKGPKKSAAHWMSGRFSWMSYSKTHLSLSSGYCSSLTMSWFHTWPFSWRARTLWSSFCRWELCHSCMLLAFVKKLDCFSSTDSWSFNLKRKKSLPKKLKRPRSWQ